MKKLICLLIFLVLASCKSKQTNSVMEPVIPYSKYVKVAVDEVNIIKINRAYDLGTRLLETCNTSKFKTFTRTEATDKVIQNATVDKISKTCHKINNRNGRFIDLQLIEIIHDVETDDYQFKYKIAYQKKYFERELSVVVNSENKVSAISTKEIAKKPL